MPCAVYRALLPLRDVPREKKHDSQLYYFEALAVLAALEWVVDLVRNID